MAGLQPGQRPDGSYAPHTEYSTVVSGGGNYTPNDNGVNLQGPQGGDYGYNAAVKGAGENYADSALGYYGAGNIPQASQNAQQAYSSFASSVPVDTSSYYNNAVRNTNNDLNRQMAARGQFGSSNAVGQLSNADTNIRAQQAHDEAQYGLQRAQLGGSLASGADQSSVAASQNQLGWTQGLGSLAFQDQNTGQNRFQQNFNNTMGMADTMSGLEGSTYNAEFGNDASNMANAIDATTGANVQANTNTNDSINRDNAKDKARWDAAAGIAKIGLGAYGGV